MEVEMKKFLSLCVLVLAMLALLVSCTPAGGGNCTHKDADDDGKCDKCNADYTDGDNQPDEPENPDTNGDDPADETSTVTVILTKAGDYKNKITFQSSQLTGTIGEDLVIPVSFSPGYTFDKSEPAGTYDATAKTITIPNLQSGNNRIAVYAREEVEYFYSFEGGKSDTSSIESDFYVEGTQVTVTAGDTQKQFVGWSFGKTAINGGEIVSTERTFTFTLNGNITNTSTSTKISVYPNYIDSNVYRYDPNGGVINTGSVNVKNTAYYSAEAKNGKLNVTLGAQYYNVIGPVASTFYDDGTFTRDGYILVEYNTKPDGTGEGFNLGAKYALKSLDGDIPTLYCIWAKATPDNTFVVKSVNIARLNSTNDAKTPYWIADGVEITSYTGNEKTVVIPEKIGGKYVTAIAADAFVGKDVETIIMGKRILRIADGAFKNCASLKVMYMPDGIAYMSDALMDDTTKDGFTDLRMNAVMPPKYSPNAWAGLFAIKLTRVMSTEGTNRLIMIGGSSIYEGLSSAYVEALLNGNGENNYSFINFGTTRTLTIMLYLDAIDHYTNKDDMVIISPENHIRAIGDTSFVQNTYDDSEGMYPSLMRHLDISKYTGVFSSLASFNKTRASRGATRYEDICKLGNGATDKYADDLSDYERRSLYRNQAGSIGYTDTYVITFNERVKSTQDSAWNDKDAQTANRDWRDPDNLTWCSFNDPKYADQTNRMIAEIKATGASVYFAFAPVDGTGVEGSSWGVIPEVKANPTTWLAAYDKLITDTFNVDGNIGKSSSYIYHHNYFYDNAYHLNNWGRTLRTYQFYVDLCPILGIKNPCSATARGTDFRGCLFEQGTTGLNPKYTVDWLK